LGGNHVTYDLLPINGHAIGTRLRAPYPGRLHFSIERFAEGDANAAVSVRLPLGPRSLTPPWVDVFPIEPDAVKRDLTEWWAQVALPPVPASGPEEYDIQVTHESLNSECPPPRMSPILYIRLRKYKPAVERPEPPPPPPPGVPTVLNFTHDPGPSGTLSQRFQAKSSDLLSVTGAKPPKTAVITGVKNVSVMGNNEPLKSGIEFIRADAGGVELVYDQSSSKFDGGNFFLPSTWIANVKGSATFLSDTVGGPITAKIRLEISWK